MYRLFARMQGESLLVPIVKSKMPCPCRSTERVMNNKWRRGCSTLERQAVPQEMILGTCEVRRGRIKKRHKKNMSHIKLSEDTRHSTTASAVAAAATEVKTNYLTTVFPEEANYGRILPSLSKEKKDENMTLDSAGKLWKGKGDDLLGSTYLCGLPEDDVDILSEHVDPVSFHEVEMDQIVTVAEEDYIDPHLIPASISPRGTSSSAEALGKVNFEHSLLSSELNLETQRQLEKDQEKKIWTKKKKKLHPYKFTVEKGRRLDPVNKNFHGKKLSKAEFAAREESFMQSLLSYVDACVQCGSLHRAMNALLFCRERGKHFELFGTYRIKDARVFEILLHGYAAEKNISKVEELMSVMREDGIEPTAQCWAACFECIGRRIDWSSNHFPGRSEWDFHLNGICETAAREKLRMFEAEMSSKGITLNHLFAETCLLYDQKRMVMLSVSKIAPNFKPVWPLSPDSGYTCRLLQDLNDFKQKVYHSPVSGLLDGEQLKEFTSEQLQIEIKDCLEVKSIELRENPNELVLYHREKLAEIQKEWREVILNALSHNIQALVLHKQNGVAGHRFMNLYPFLMSVRKEELVELALQEIKKLAEGSENFSHSKNQLYRELGSRVLERYQVYWKERTGILDKVKLLYEKYCDWFANPEGVELSEKQIDGTRQAWQSLIHSHQDKGASLNFRERNWPVHVQIGIGKFLYDIILREIRFDINALRPNHKQRHLVPAFYALFRSKKYGKLLKEEVKPHPALARLFRGAASDTLKFPARCVPMLCPPTPWTTFLSGGYLLVKADVIRVPQHSVLQWNRLANCPTQQLHPALDSLNQLGAVPWKVNKQVLDVVVEVFNTGGSSQLAIPAPPSSSATVQQASSSESSNSSSSVSDQSNKEEIFQKHKQHLHLQRKKAEAYGLWCDMLYRLSLANHFRDRIFWLPHNMDFRGRVYPCPPHLNHLGSDVARSLLCFAKGQPLGSKGLDWLKLHLVNLTGLMKRNSIEERKIFAENMIPKIIDSAEKPLTGERWWTKSDEPWQTLAVCMEIKAAMNSEGGPENYVCHFPVHQDGSCNGLQHYAALGRDEAGAASVSMAPSECPQDVYSVVAAMIEREREKDAALGVEIARVLDGFVRRKVIKQTVMTTVYGVTRYGARLQIARQLRDIDEFPKEHVWRASTYLVGKTFGCLQEMFTSTKKIQDWFTDCAHHISQDCGRTVEWVTPLGLPVVQPYHRALGSKRNDASDPLSAGSVKRPYGVVGNHERPNVMKQKNAFPPNFIHSIDSSHMMLTSLWCERKGLTFVSVHDCYWTHPSTVGTMNKICREQFVALHSQPILENLSSSLVQNYSHPKEDFAKDNSIMAISKRMLDTVLSRVPEKGDFNLRSVIDSVYFFS